jgi:6-phosphofructokinase 2
MQTIVTLTMNPTLDKSASIDQVVPDRKLRCQTLRQEPGGGGINVARAIRKLRGNSLALYPAGGLTGDLIKALLDEEGLNHQPLPIESLTREGLMVVEQATGQQFRFNLPGPTLKESEWRRCLDELAGLDPPPDYLVASGSLPEGVPYDFFARVAQLAHEKDIRLILDTSTSQAARQALEEGVYLIKPNLREFRELVGSDLEKEVEQEARAKEIVKDGQATVVVVSLGAAGVLMATEDGCERLRAPTVSIESKVGAGDSSVAGIALSLARGKTVRKSVQFGIAAGASAVMTPGSELCRREDTERLYQSMASN